MSLKCEQDCCKRAYQGQHLRAQTQTTTTVQKQVQPAIVEIPVVDLDTTEPDLATSMPPSETAPVSAAHAPIVSGTVPCTTETPAPTAALRRSARVGKGMTCKYNDYVQPLQDSSAVEVNMLSAIQLMPAMYCTEPTYCGEPPTGMYNRRYPYNLVIFKNPNFLPTLVGS